MAGDRAGGSGVGTAAARLARQHISRPIRDRMAYIMVHAELTGVVCSGPRVGRQFTHALLDERVPPVRLVAREEALADVAARYWGTRAPATAHDFAKWCGLIVGTWRRVLARGRATIEPSLFIRFSRAERNALGAAAGQYRAFLGLPVDVMDAQDLPTTALGWLDVQTQSRASGRAAFVSLGRSRPGRPAAAAARDDRRVRLRRRRRQRVIHHGGARLRNHSAARHLGPASSAVVRPQRVRGAADRSGAALYPPA